SPDSLTPILPRRNNNLQIKRPDQPARHWHLCSSMRSVPDREKRRLTHFWEFMGSEVHDKGEFLIGLELMLINEQLLRGLACFKRSADKFQWKMKMNRLWSEFVIWLTCLSYVAGAYKFFVLCIVGTNTKDRVKFHIHKQVIDLFSSLDVVKQITSITIEPGIADKFNTSES
ncbi:hypothetical protein HID58_001484, partial [Brassica napus]